LTAPGRGGTVPAVTTSTGIDTREMVVVHTAFRRELGAAPQLVRAVAAGDRDRSRVVADHVQLLLDLLHHHHTSEDELLWPALLERVPAELAPVVHLMEAQHEAIAEELEHAEAAVGPWRAAAGETVRDRLAGALERMHPLLVEHLTAEEEQVLPLAARALTQAEWDELGRRGTAAIPRPKLPMVFGMLMAEGDPEVLRMVLAHAPLLPRVVVPRIAPRAYGRYTRHVQGVPRQGR
jgi:hemerythrin-like domain-containing protein